MNVYAYINIEVEKNGRRYFLSAPVGSPFSECREVINELPAHIDQLEAQTKEQFEAVKRAQSTPAQEVEAEIVS